MKKLFKLSILFALLTCILSSASAYVAKPKVKDLMEERSVVFWVEGVRFSDDMILDARGSITVTYLDSKLSAAITDDKLAPQWMRDLNQYYGTKNSSKKVIFIAQVQANKIWDFKYGEMFVGNYKLQKGDVLSYGWDETVEIAADEVGEMAFAVPASEVVRGKAIKVGYGEYSAELTVPK